MSGVEKVYGGTGLSESQVKDGSIFVEHDALDCEYTWDAGAAIGRYLQELKNGRIIGRECDECGRTLVPPRMFCELCWKPSDRWVYVKDTGVVNTFSLCYVNWDASRVEPGQPPHMPAVIELDGATEMVGIMHRLGDVDPQEIKIGMRVQAVWKPEAERTGSITDIKYFKPY